MSEVVYKENIIISWIMWQFWEVPNFLIQVWKNYIMFALNYFSLPLLFKTLISPWRRNAWAFPKAFDFMEYLNVIISNIFSRIIGFFLRIALIITGAIFQIFVLLAGLVVILFWLLIPFIIICTCLILI